MIQVILLAAGLSTRFGEANKLLQKIDSQSVLSHTLTNLHLADLGQIIIVTGLDRELILDELPQQIDYREVYNPNYSLGMTSSIQTGINASSEDISAFMICLADQIFIQPITYKSLAHAFTTELQKGRTKLILTPVYQKTNGNPVVLSSIYRDEILNLKSENGCKPIVQKYATNLLRWNTDDPGVIQDIDTLEDLERSKKR